MLIHHNKNICYEIIAKRGNRTENIKQIYFDCELRYERRSEEDPTHSSQKKV